MSEWQSELDIAIETAREAGMFLRSCLGKVAAREKGRYDLVTEADIEAQRMIAAKLASHFPHYRFVGEESPAEDFSAEKELSEKTRVPRWVVDPLDGTTNFVHQVPFFCVSIALVDANDVPLCGVIYDPMREEFFTAQRGGGAFLNGKSLAVSEVKTLDEALISISFPTEVTPESPSVKMLLTALPQTQAVRRTGSTALNLAYVAAGRFDVAWGFQAKSWDVAAATLLIREAGGIITTPRGEENVLLARGYLAASTKPLYETVLEMMNLD